MIRRDVDRVPARNLFDRELDHVGDELERSGRREDVGTARQVFLDDVVLRRALQFGACHALSLRHPDVEREQPAGGRVDRHRRVHAAEGDSVQQGLHVADRVDRHADLPDLAHGERVVAVIAGLRGQIERDRQSRLPLREVLAVQPVRRLGRRMAGVGAHDPRTVGHGPSRLPQTARVFIRRERQRSHERHGPSSAVAEHGREGTRGVHGSHMRCKAGS